MPQHFYAPLKFTAHPEPGQLVLTAAKRTNARPPLKVHPRHSVTPTPRRKIGILGNSSLHC